AYFSWSRASLRLAPMGRGPFGSERSDGLAPAAAHELRCEERDDAASFRHPPRQTVAERPQLPACRRNVRSASSASSAQSLPPNRQVNREQVRLLASAV